MKNKILITVIVILIFFGGISYTNYRISNEDNKDNSFISNIDRKEMNPLDSLRYKFL